jgi:hypothetical protein
MRPKIQNREIVYHACMKGSRKMKKAPSETASADDLRADFHNLYGCGRDFEGNTLIDIVVRVGSLVAEIVGEEPAAAGFSQITRSLGYDVADPAGWAEALQNQAITDAYCWPMGAKLHDLNAYAYYGIALNGARTAAEREALLREQIEAVTAFMDRVPFKAWGIQSGDAGQTMELARPEHLRGPHARRPGDRRRDLRPGRSRRLGVPPRPRPRRRFRRGTEQKGEPARDL